MKKKFFVSMILACLAGAAFAAEDISTFSLKLGVSFPQIFNLRPAETNVKSTQYSSWGINFGARGNLGSFGIFADGNFYFPFSYKMKYEVSSGGQTITYTEKYKIGKDLSSCWGVEGILGVYTVLLNTGRLTIPVGGGIHLGYSKSDFSSSAASRDETSNVFGMGLGGFVNLEFSLTDRIAIFAGLTLNFDFYEKTWYKQTTVINGTPRTVTVSEKSDSDACSKLWVNPAVGVVFHF